MNISSISGYIYKNNINIYWSKIAHNIIVDNDLIYKIIWAKNWPMISIDETDCSIYIHKGKLI